MPVSKVYINQRACSMESMIDNAINPFVLNLMSLESIKLI
jgi:hypothetical protein